MRRPAVWAMRQCRSLLAGRGNRIVATRDGRIVDLDMEEALAMTKAFEMDRYDVLEALTNNDAFGYGKQ